MKKTIILMFALLVLTGLLFCACGKNDKKDNTDNGNNLPTFETVDEANAINLSTYTIIRSDSGTKDEKNAAIELRDIIEEKCGYKLDMKVDLSGSASGLEIVIGQTRRGGADQLNKAQYVIRHNEKGFLIAGGSDVATIAAVNFFIDNLLTPSGAICASDFKYEIDNSLVIGDKTYDEVNVFVGIKGENCSAEILDFYAKLGVPAKKTRNESEANIILTSDSDVKVSSINEGNWGVTVENGILYIVGRDEYGVIGVSSFVCEYLEGIKGKTIFENGVLKMEKTLTREEFYEKESLVIYPEFERIKRDYMYSVSVTQGDKTATIPVYNHTQDYPAYSRDNIGADNNRRFSLFAFSGGQVRVDVKVGCDFESYTVMPSAKEFKSEFKDGVISVYLDKPEYFVIRLNNDTNTILSIFADYPEYPLDIPSKEDPNVLWISGVQEAEGGNTLLANDNQIVYLEPGSVFFSRIKLAGANCKVLGRGALVDPYENFYKTNPGDEVGATHKFILMSGANGYVDGPVLVDAHCYNFTSWGGATVRNAKALSVMLTSDGLTMLNRDCLVERCFIYSGDNGIVCSGRNIVFRDVMIGTSCGAIYPQNDIESATMEGIYVFRADEGIINNYYNSDGTKAVERKANITINGLYTDDCPSIPYFFKGRNMGRADKIFNIANVTCRSPRGVVNYYDTHTNVFVLFNTIEGQLFTDNYTLNIKNLYVDGKLVTDVGNLKISQSGSDASNKINITSDDTKVVTRKDYSVNYKNSLNVFIGELQVFLKDAVIEEGGKTYLPADETVTLLRSKGEVNTVEKNGIAYVEMNDFVTAGLATKAEKNGNAVIISPVVKKGNLLLADSGDIPYFTEHRSYCVDMTARIEDDETIYTLANIIEADSGIRRALTSDIKMYGNGKYKLNFEISGVGEIKVKVVYQTTEASESIVEEFISLSGAWDDFEAEFDVNMDLSGLKNISFCVVSKDASLKSFEIKNITLKKIG